MSQLLNNSTGKVEDVDDAPSAIAAGTHVPVGGKVLVDPSGQVVTTPTNAVFQAVTKYGYRVPTQPELTEYANQQQYGEGTGNEVKAFGAGVLRGGTFGTSDYALPAMGITTQEALAQRAQRNPVATLGGELTGAVGSGLLMPEASPVGLLGKAGEGVTAGARALFGAGEVGEGATLAARALAGAKEVGARAIGSAVEGAAFGAGQSVSEQALGDPDLTAEKVIGNIGMGAILGGALGGVIKAGQMAIPAGLSTASEGAKSVWTAAFGAPERRAVLRTAEAVEPEVGLEATGTEGAPAAPAPEAPPAAATPAPEAPPAAATPPEQPSLFARASAKVTGQTPEDVQEMLNRPVNFMTPEERNIQAGVITDNLNELDASTEKATQEVNTARPQEKAELLANADPQAIAAETDRLIGSVRGVREAMEAEPKIFDQGTARELQIVEDKLAAIHADPDSSPTDRFLALDDAKNDLYAAQKTSELAPRGEKKAAALAREAYGQVKDSLENPEVWGDAAVRQSKYNSALNEHITARKNLMKFLGTKEFVKSGRQISKVDGTKVGVMVNGANSIKQAKRVAAVDEYLRTSKNIHEQILQTLENAKFESNPARAKAMAELQGRTSSAVLGARNAVTKAPGGLGFFTDLFNPVGAFFKHGAEALKNPEVFAAKLANIERTAGKTSNVIGRAAKAIFQPVAKLTTKGSGVLKEVLTPAEKVDRFKDRLSEVQSVPTDPEALASHISDATADGFDVAPKVTQAIQMAMLRGNQYLRSVAPQPPAQLPFDQEWRPNSSQVSSFDRAYETVENPTIALDHLKAGTLTPDHVQALQAVYPKLLGEMRQELLSELVSRQAKGNLSIPYQRRLQLSTFMGQPLDSAVTQQMIASNQASNAAPTQQSPESQGKMPNQKPVRTSQKGLSSLDLADRTKTSQQDAVSRERA